MSIEQERLSREPHDGGDAWVDALESAFTTHFAALVRFAALLGADDPEDLAQEALARLLDRRPKNLNAGAELQYARTTVLNLSRSRARRLHVARKHEHVAEPVDSAESLALLREDHRLLVQALGRLPRRQREVIVLRYWAGLSEAEIAATLGVSAGTVKSTAHKAQKRLGQSLEGIR